MGLSVIVQYNNKKGVAPICLEEEVLSERPRQGYTELFRQRLVQQNFLLLDERDPKTIIARFSLARRDDVADKLRHKKTASI